nr:carboxypeptidase-like regulatory domain-containing protein [Endomicrobiia bacterium]
MKKIFSLCALMAMMCLSPVYGADKYKIVGFVTDADGNALSNIAVKITGDVKLTEKNDSMGYYKFENLDKGLKLDVFIDEPGLKFAPEAYKIKKLKSDEYVDFKLKSGSVESKNVKEKEKKPVVQESSTPKAAPEKEKKPSAAAPVEKTPEPKKQVPGKFKMSGIVSEKGRGISGVLIRVISADREYRAETDKNGYYEILNLPAGKDFIIRPSKGTLSFMPSEIVLNNSESDKALNFAVSSEKFSISGRVANNKNKPIDSAKIFVSGSDNKFITLTDDKGMYKFIMPSGVSYILKASKAGFREVGTTLPSLNGDRVVNFILESEKDVNDSRAIFEGADVEAKPVPVEPKPSAPAAPKTDKKQEKEKPEPVAKSDKVKTITIKGVIGDDKTYVENVTVTLEPGGHKTVTDSKGRFSFELAPVAMEYFLKPEKEDMIFEPEMITINNFKNATYNFKPFVILEGSVFSNKRPLPGASVMLTGVPVATTDSFGKFQVKAPYGASAVITVSKNVYDFYPAEIYIDKAEKSHSNLDFISIFSISGKIEIQGIGKSGYSTPASGVEIEVSGSTKTSVVTDYAGKYAISGLAAGGRFKLTPKTGGFAFTPQFRESISLSGDLPNQDFTATKETYTVKGNVNVGGRPVINAIVMVSKTGMKYFTDTQGNFEIQGLEYGGPYTFSVQSREYKFDPITIENLRENTVIEFNNDIILSGIVKSGDIVVPGVTVNVNGEKHKTDKDGRFSVKLRYDGDYVVYLSGSGMTFEPERREFKRVQQNILNEVFEASLIISGKVTGTGGRAIEGASVTLNYDDAYLTDENGYFLIKNVTMGRDYVLEVAYPGYKFSPARKDLRKLMNSRMAEDFQGTKIK